MKKPKATDYGLVGDEYGTRADFDSVPITTDEYEEALGRLIGAEIYRMRDKKFRDALHRWDWSNGGR